LKFDFDMGVLFKTNDDAVVKIATTAGNSLGSKCKVNKTLATTTGEYIGARF